MGSAGVWHPSPRATIETAMSQVPAGWPSQLTAAEPEGYVRLFVDEGHAMMALLREASRRGITTDYISELLVGWVRPSHRRERTQGSSCGSATGSRRCSASSLPN
jgi:hypothetical protein